ncbi:MAG: hypothetical protein FWE03_02275 [Firmicutes bacterium]|nr:hypothetical protein [Bacillota bacterium]
MATVKMSYLKIIANCSDKKSVLRLLTKSGCFEIAKAEDIETDEYKLSQINDELIKNQSKIVFAIKYLEDLMLEASELNKKLCDDIEPFNIEQDSNSKIKINLSFEQIESINKDGLIKICDELKDIEEKRNSLKNKIKDLTELNIDLMKFSNIDISFSKFKDTRTSSAILAVSQPLIDKEFFKKFDCYVQEFDSSELSVLGIICKIEDKPRLLRKLDSQSFDICTYDYDLTAKELINQNIVQIDEADLNDVVLIKKALAYQNELANLKILHDAIELEIEQEHADSNIFITQENSVIIEGWVPSAALNQIKSTLNENIPNLELESRAVKLSDSPPSLAVNKKLFKPFESVTTGYGAPTYGEGDPSPIMSIFFFVFFGIMLADAGYGLIMAVGGILVGLLSKKIATPLKRMVLMLGICGISGIIFGLLFGGVFAIDSFPALWFNPMHDPVMMLIFSLSLGVVHLLTGYTLRTIKTIKADVAFSRNKKAGFLKILDGLFDSVFMYMLFIGILLFLMPMLFENTTFPFSIIAIIMLIASLVGILLTGGRRAPSIAGKIAGGFGGLYKLINLFSDVLSYSRLFGLALASGAIAMAFNQIGMMLFAIPAVGVVLGAIALIVLHLFNFALAALAAYVHDIRLQYVEFFGKFYDGNGRFFMPLGSNTKYVNLV